MTHNRAICSFVATPVMKQACAADKKAGKELSIYRLLVKQDVTPTFPIVQIALRLYLCNGERTFSKLKRIKNELRSTMGLSLMSIECDVQRNVNFSSIAEKIMKGITFWVSNVSLIHLLLRNVIIVSFT